MANKKQTPKEVKPKGYEMNNKGGVPELRGGARGSRRGAANITPTIVTSYIIYTINYLLVPYILTLFLLYIIYTIKLFILILSNY